MDNNENKIQEEAVEMETIDMPETEAAAPYQKKLDLDPDIAKGVAIIGGCAILAWEGVKWTGRKIGNTKLGKSVKSKIKSLGKKPEPVDEVEPEDTEKETE